MTEVVQADIDRYDAGLLGDGGGGNVEWWQDYLRAELERAHEFYADQFADRIASEQATVERCAKVAGDQQQFAPRNDFNRGRLRGREEAAAAIRRSLSHTKGNEDG